MRVMIVGVLMLVLRCAQAQPQLEMPMVGQNLPSARYELVNRIPASHLARVPTALPIFRYSGKASEFRIESLQKLIDQSIFAGMNVSDVLHRRTNVTILDESIRLAGERNLDSLFVDPLQGAVILQAHGIGIDLRRESPAYDEVPNFEVIRERLFRYAEMFGVSTNQMDRKPDGSIHLLKTDDKKIMRGGALEFISRRSVAVSRSIAGYTFLANQDKLELALGVKGSLQKFQMSWPSIEAVRTNQLLTTERVIQEIKQGNALADVSNEYPADGVSQVILKDIAIQYYAYSPRGYGPVSTNRDIFPVASFYAVFKSKSGKATDGGLYAPILDPLKDAASNYDTKP